MSVSGAPEPPVFTYLGVNSYRLDIGGQRLLVDPFLTGDLVFFGQRWMFAGSRRAAALAAAPRPEEVAGLFDALVLSQGLEDHTHLPTLRAIDRRVRVIGSPRAAEVACRLGFTDVMSLEPGASALVGPYVRITAVPGSVVGPPWESPENGWVFADTRPGGLALGAEPHGNFLGPALGTSFRMLPKPPPVHVDALLMPLTSQDIAGYRLVNGAQEALSTLEALDPVPRFVIPLENGDIDAEGALAKALQTEGSPSDFAGELRSRPRLAGVRVLGARPGEPVRLE